MVDVPINYMGLDGFVWWMGVVEDRYDPEQLGRVRVRCVGWHSNNQNAIPTSDLPWAHVMHPVTDPAMHGMGLTPSFLVEGTWVMGFFRDQEKQQPIVLGTLPGIPENPANFRAGFNDPRHKKSEQVNTQGKKQYAKEDKDGKFYNPGEAGGTIEDYDPKYSQQSYGPYPLGAFVNGEDDEEGVFSRSSGHTFGEADTNRLARNAGHGVLAAKDSIALTGVMLPHSDQTAREDNINYSDDTPRNSGVDIYGNKVKKDDVFLDAAGNYPTMAGQSIGPNSASRPSFIAETSDINDQAVHPIPAAGSPESVDASETADAINPLMNKTDSTLTNEKWNEPKTTDPNKSGTIRYAAVYPYNHVFETESGHIKEFDDTPGSERIHEYHTSGTFYEVDADGNKHTRVVGNDYEIIAGTNFVNIKGDVNLTIESNCKTYIKGDWNIQVGGNKYETIGGNAHETIGGNHISLIKGEREETVEKNVIETYGTDKEKNFHTRLVTGSTNDTVLRNVTETYGTSTEHFRSTTITGTDTKSTGLSTNLTTGTSWNYTIGTTWAGTTGSTWTHTSGGDITITGGPNINLNP